MWLQVTMPAAHAIGLSYGPLGILVRWLSLGGAAARARKAVGLLVTRRQFGGIANDQFAMSMGTTGRGGQIWRFYRHIVACAWCCQWEGSRVLARSKRGVGEKKKKCPYWCWWYRVTGLTKIFWCVMFNALFFNEKKYGGGGDVNMLLD
jgi:hypothetical protein